MRTRSTKTTEDQDHDDTEITVSTTDPFVEFRTGAIDEKALSERCRGNPDRLVRLAHMYRDGDGVDSDPDEWRRLLGQALEGGCREAGWEILGSPEREGEDIHGYFTGRTGTVWTMRHRDEERIIAPNQIVVEVVEDDGFEDDAKERAAEHPEIAASVICAGFVGSDREEFEEWVALAKDAFRKDVLCERGDYEMGHGDPEKGIALLEEAAGLGSVEAHMQLGKELFTGFRTGRDLDRAFRHLLDAAEGGDGDAPLWLALFEDLPPAGRGDGRLNPHIRRGHGRSKLKYGFPEWQRETIPEYVVLQDMLGMDYHSCSFDDRFCDRYDGFENDVFWIRPYYWGDPDSEDYDAARADMPNFRFKPTGFAVEWYKYPFRDSYMNRDLDLTAIRAIWRVCIQSVLDQADRGEFA